jgi:hypothetical protein
MDEPEVILNFWYVTLKDTPVIYKLLARAYVVEGTDEQKQQVLESLAKTDYLVAQEFQVPERFYIASPEGKTIKRVALWEAHDGYVFELFNEAIDELEKNLPEHRFFDGQKERRVKARIPDTIQFLLTPLIEDDEGKILALA